MNNFRSINLQEAIDDAFDYLCTIYSGLNETGKEKYDNNISLYANDYVETCDMCTGLSETEKEFIIDSVVNLWNI